MDCFYYNTAPIFVNAFLQFVTAEAKKCRHLTVMWLLSLPKSFYLTKSVPGSIITSEC